KTTGAVAGAAMVGGVATPGLQALAADEKTGKEEVLPGRCYFGGCFSCNYDVTVRDGHAVKVAPNPEALYGRRPCLRGLSQVQRLYSNDRIQYPMKRVGERGENKWERISWEEAIATITDKWQSYMKQYGGQSIALSNASGGARYLPLVRSRMTNILKMTTFDLSVDWAFYTGLHRVYGNPATGIMTTPGNEPFEKDVFNAKTVFMWGHNISEAYLQRWRYLMDAQAQGVKIVAIDPNQTMTATRSDKWYAPRPGTDPALMLSMIQVIIEEKLHDVDYLTKSTVGPYLVREDSKKFLRMSDLGVAPTEGPVDPMTRKPTVIDPPVVWDITLGKAASSAESATPALEGSWVVEGIKTTTAFDLLVKQVQEYTPDKVSSVVELTPEQIHELALLAADGPVTHMSGMGAQAYDNGLHIGTGIATLMAVTGMVGKPGAGLAGAAFPVPMNASFLFPTGTFATGISVLEVPEVIKTGTYQGKEYPPIKSLLISSCGLVGGATNLNVVLSDIIDKIEFIVCADIVFSDSARWSDIVLPVANTFEIEDIYCSPVTNHLQYGARVIEPAFEAKSDQEMTKLLAEGMGIGKYFQGNDESWLRELLDLPDLKKAGITLDALREKGSIRFKPEGVAYEDGKYSTSTGKVEIYSENPLPRIEFGQARDLDAEHLPRFFSPYEAYPGTEAMEKYPLILISERSRNRWHSQGFDGVWLREINPEPTIRLNIEDAKTRGIENGDYVEVYNDRGHAVAKAYLCAGMRPGMMSYPKGWQTHLYKAGNFSELSHSHYDPFAVSSSFFDTCVDARKWNGGN
ncbi:MAG: molybdopterin-dependent oxidoreductase, partial [Raoultibacter sp.]